MLVPLTGRLLRRRVAGFYSAVDSQDLARRRGLGHEGNGTHREPLAPLSRRTEIDMDEPRARVEAEAEEPDLARRRLEATGSWFAMAMSKAAPSRCLERVAPPTVRLCSGLR